MKYLSKIGISLLVLAVLAMLCYSPALADTVVSGNTVLNLGNTGYYGPVTAEDNATVNYLGSGLSTTIGGNPSFNINGLDHSTINILYPANLPSQAVAFGNSTINVLDTTPASAEDDEPDGGSIVEQYFVGQAGILNLSGTGLTLTLLGKNWYDDYGLNVWLDRYQLSGMAPDGWPFAPPGSPNGGTIVSVQDTGLPTLTFQVKVNGTTVLGAGMLSSLLFSSTVSGGIVRTWNSDPERPCLHGHCRRAVEQRLGDCPAAPGGDRAGGFEQRDVRVRHLPQPCHEDGHDPGDAGVGSPDRGFDNCRKVNRAKFFVFLALLLGLAWFLQGSKVSH